MIKIIIALSLLLAACSKSNNRSTPQGGQDSGGGNTVFSTDEDIKKEYDSVMSDLPSVVDGILNEDFFVKIHDQEKVFLLRLFKHKLEKQSKIPMAKAAVSLPKSNDSDNEDDVLENEDEEISVTRETFQKIMDASKVTIKADGPCVSTSKPHGYASIKEYKVGSPICLSFYQLRNIPRDSLYKEIMGVMLHEYLHALKFEEKSVIMIQTIITNNFSAVAEVFEYKDAKYSPMELQNLEVSVALANESIKKFALEAKSLTNEEQGELCTALSKISVLQLALYEKYLSPFAKLQPRLVNQGIISESIVAELSPNYISMMFSLEHSHEFLFDSCKNGSRIKITPDLRLSLLFLYNQVTDNLGAVQEIKFYMEQIY